MAKKSAIENNLRKQRLVKKFAARRKRLLDLANDQARPMEERFEARIRLAALPRNGAIIRVRNRCQVTGRPRGYYRKMKMSRIALRELGNQGLIPGLVKSSWRGGKNIGANHPLGDMLTRIRNAQMRKRGKVSTPGSSLRQKVLDVLQAEGYIRGYSTTDYGNGRTEFEIDLKYFDNEPVIRKIERVSKPGRRVYAAVDAMPRVANGLGVTIISTPKGVMADHSARENNVGGEVLCTVF